MSAIAWFRLYSEHSCNLLHVSVDWNRLAGFTCVRRPATGDIISLGLLCLVLLMNLFVYNDILHLIDSASE